MSLVPESKLCISKRREEGMNKIVKEDIREALADLKRGDATISETLSDICEIVDDYNKFLRKQRSKAGKLRSKQGKT